MKPCRPRLVHTLVPALQRRALASSSWGRQDDWDHVTRRLAFVEAIQTCQAARAWQHALELRSTMLREGYGHCRAGFHALLMKHWVGSSGWCNAVHVLEEMKLCEVSPSSITFSLVVGTCRQAEEWKWPVALIHRMILDEDLEELPLASVAGACQQAGQWRWSLWLLELQQRPELPVMPSDFSFNLALSICKV